MFEAHISPFKRLKDEKDRPAAQIINSALEGNPIPELKLYDVGLGEPFLFYLKMPYRSVKAEELSKGGSVFLCSSAGYGKLINIGVARKDRTEFLRSFKIKKTEYFIARIR